MSAPPRSLAGIRRAADWLTLLAGWGLLAFCAAVGVEVVGRRYLGFSLQGVDEIGGYLMALVVATGFSAALCDNAHIRIDLLLPRLPRRLTLWLHVAAVASLSAFASMLVWQGATLLAESNKLKAVAPTPLHTPLVIPQGIWLAALTFFLVACFAFLGRILLHAVRGEADEAAALLGSSAGRPSPKDRR